jgi:hypothetical protein
MTGSVFPISPETTTGLDSSLCETVLKAQNCDLGTALATARKFYDEAKLAELRSDRSAALFVAGTAMLIREGRRDPDRFSEECKRAGIKRGGKRQEVCAMRLAAADPHLKKPRWANAAAYIAEHPDEAPTLAAAAELISRTPNGITGLSNLYAAQHKQSPEPVDMTEWADAQLEGIPPDACFDAGETLASNAPTFAMAIVRRMPDGSSRIWRLHEADGFGEPQIRRAVKKVKNRTILEDGPRTYIERSIDARVQGEGSGVLDAASSDDDHGERAPTGDDIETEKREHARSRSKVELPMSSAPKFGLRKRLFSCQLPCGCQHSKECRKQRRCVEPPAANKTTPVAMLLAAE